MCIKLFQKISEVPNIRASRKSGNGILSHVVNIENNRHENQFRKKIDELHFIKEKGKNKKIYI